MYHACMHTRPPARPASRAAAPPPKVSLLALEDNQSSAFGARTHQTTTDDPTPRHVYALPLAGGLRFSGGRPGAVFTVLLTYFTA